MDVALFAHDEALARRLRHAFKDMGARVECYACLPKDSAAWQSRKFDLLVVHATPSQMALTNSSGRPRDWAQSAATIALVPQEHMVFAHDFLDAGFDQCLPLSLDSPSLRAFVRTLLRRRQGLAESVSHYGALSFNYVTQQAFLGDVAVNLTHREAQVLEILLKRVGQIVPKERFIQDIAPDNHICHSNAAEVYIHRLRKKFSDEILPVRNIKRCGYLLPRRSQSSMDSVLPRHAFVDASPAV